MRRGTGESIDAYMRSIRDSRPLSREDERSLARTIRSSEGAERRAALDRLVCANLRLVVKIAHDYKTYGLGLPDLVAEGNLGLMLAAERFDPDNGAKFSCYAAWWIKQSMRKAIAWQSRTIRIPGGSAQHKINIDKARGRWLAEHGEEPGIEDLMEMTGYARETIDGLARAATETLSMDAMLSDDSDTAFAESLTEEETDADRTRRASRRSALERALGALTALEGLLVRGLYGIGVEPMSAMQLGVESGLSLKAVQARLAGALAKLRVDPALAAEFA